MLTPQKKRHGFEPMRQFDNACVDALRVDLDNTNLTHEMMPTGQTRHQEYIMALVEEISNQLNPIDCLRGACVGEKAFRDEVRDLKQYEFVMSLYALGENKNRAKLS
jgi:hypothetical protein